MQMSDDIPPLAVALREETMNGIAGTMADVLARLTPVTRLRLLAFLHLCDRPETIKADLSIEPSGSVRLSLSQAIDQERPTG